MARNRIKTGALEPKLAVLVTELGSIAKQRFPLDEANLVTCEHLLKCMAVTQLVAAASHDDKPPAAYVAIAIEQAIGRIDLEEDQDIAEAMFALISPAYKGQTVAKRKELLAEDRKIIKSRWDDRRNGVLIAVATQLRNPPDTPSAVSAPQPVLTSKTSLLSGLELQAQQAVILHFAGLTTLFVRQFDQTLYGPDTALRTPSQAYFFNAYITLVYGPWFETRQSPSGTLSIHEAYEDNLSKTIAARVDQLVQALDEHSPIGPTRNMANSAVRALHIFAQVRATIHLSSTDLLVFNELLPSVDAYAWVDQDGEPMDQSSVPSLMSVYNTWGHWLRNDLASGKAEGIALLTSASGTLAALLGEHFGSVMRMRDIALALAHKAISSYYDMPEWELLGDGKSLKQHADAFFDQPRLLSTE